ncbi:MAG: tRNA lysidine(34) synthetase TilS, partial [Gemmatimonadetes bacterium]|nr:tRNA lysidine(34) synthetase TilS [Gemmatimonadota bacterium]
PGDRILPLGGVGHRRVSRVLMERRIPRSERKSFPLLTRGESVIWLPGICRSDVAVPEPGEAAVRLEVTSVGDP